MTKTNVFKSYKQRLIKLDSRNDSFFLSTLKNNKHIDLVEIHQNLQLNYNLLNTIYDSNKIVISQVSYHVADLKKLFRRKNYRQHILKYIPFFTEQDFLKYDKLINNNVKSNIIDDYLNKTISKYDLYKDKLFRQFKLLENENKAIIRNLGKDDLYLGFPFVEGKFPSGRVFRGPLILHRIKIKNTNNDIIIEINKKHKIINPIFLLTHINENNNQYKRYDFEIPEDEADYISYTLDFLKKELVNIAYYNEKLSPIEKISKKAYEKKYNKPVNHFEVVNYVILGLFPISDRSIYNDLDYLDKNINIIPKSLRQFLFGSKAYQDYKLKQIAPQEDQIKYISPLDLSQRIVIKNALDDNLVIEGPPGTGKSQTIVNLVVNLLLQNKKVLIVSEKVAAIDVVYNRLGRLKSHALIIADHLRDKDEFFSQILNTEQVRKEGYKKPIYDSLVDKDLNYHLNAYKQVNNKNYYKNLSLEEVITIVNTPLKKEYKETYKTIDRYLYNLSDDKNIKVELDKLFDDQFISIIQSYKKMAKRPVFKHLSLRDVIFFYEQSKSTNNKLQVEYNYFLLNKEKQPINFIDADEFKTNLTPIDFSYSKLGEYSQNLFNKITKHKRQLIELNKPIYEAIKNNPPLLNLAINWDSFDDEAKKMTIKRSFKPKYKRSFLKRLFKLKIKLNPKELDIYEYFYNYHSSLNIRAIKAINNNFLYTDLILANEFTSRNYKTHTDLISLLLVTDLVSFKNQKFNKLYKKFSLNKAGVDFQIITKLKGYTYADINLVIAYLQTRASKEDFKNNCLKRFISKQVAKEALNYQHYLKTANNNHINEHLNKKLETTENYVYNYVRNANEITFKNFPEIHNDYNNGLLHNASLKRRKSVRFIFERYGKVLHSIYPVMLMTPEVVSAVFEMKKDLFDYVVFDEASQMFIERAVPAIFRSKQVVIAGDSKQLKPSSIFQTRLTESDILEDDEFVSNEELAAYDKESLLEMAKTKYKAKMLKYHYRSVDQSLIEFSSAAFYGGELIFDSQNIYKNKIKPIEIYPTYNGKWSDKNTNIIEARKIVDVLLKLMKQRKNNETFGIITFNIQQKQLIENMLYDLKDNSVLAELERVNPLTGDDESLFVKNIENVQGDERDIILFSVTYARDKKDRLNTYFGSLSQYGGENRLNVAITRAKKKIVIVKSFDSAELKLSNKTNMGPVRFKQYLEFVEYVDKGLTEHKNTLLTTMVKQTAPTFIPQQKQTCPFAEKLYKLLINSLSNNLVVKREVNVGIHYLDIAIYDKKTNHYILGILCDGNNTSLTEEQLEQAYFKRLYLETRGWNTITIYKMNFLENKQVELAKINRAVRQLLREKQTI